MKATGIVRRIDDLGRIVIPKEIRRSLGVCEGDTMEIFIDHENNGIVLCQYQSDENAVSLLKQAAKMLENDHNDYYDLINYIADKLGE